MIPRLAIDDVRKLVDKAIDGNFPLDEEIQTYLWNFEDESTKKLRDMNTTIASMFILGVEGPLVLQEYKHICRERGVEPYYSLDILSLAREAVRKREDGLYAACALITLVTAVPTTVLATSALVVQAVYGNVKTKERKKKALLQFYQEE